ncbi:MAG: SusC/RagA family TonB-linked outer membrane protein [Bacteroidetes bacterium]|nr:SusC/RagA family TonB-linked outer membrane protein [Bacteroidota bacterium]MBS1539603.1 SusC/RagA family TonB-linked outer membrane protein [Bacteroidota bacterium]
MKKFLLMCFSFGFAISVWAQDRVVTGKLTSKEDGSALPGVNVVLKGTTNGTVSDGDGKYSISVPSSGGTLVYSFIGLETLEVEVGARAVVDVQLGSDIKQLTEVVVTGAGVATDKKKLGISVEAISSDKLPAAPTASIDQALIGKVAGAQITSTSGNPGDPVNIVLRGINTVQGGTRPLILVDGVQVGSNVGLGGTDLNSIDLSNIERVEVVQGAASAALYGAQGANGVIQLFTKKGRKGTFNIDVSSSYAVNENINVNNNLAKISLHPYQTDASGNLVNGSGTVLTFGPIGNLPGVRYRFGSSTSGAASRYGILGLQNVNDQPFKGNIHYYDHFKQIFKQGFTTNNSISLRGGTDKTDYNITVSNNHTLTNILNYGGLDRTNLSVNLGTELFRGVTLRSTTQVVYTRNDMGPNLGAPGGVGYGSGNQAGSQGNGVYGFLNTPSFMDLTFTMADGTPPVYQPGGSFLGVNGFNPYYRKYYSQAIDNKVDVIQNFDLNYKVNKFLELDAKYGMNYRNEDARWTYFNQSLNDNSNYYITYTSNYNSANNEGEIDNYQYTSSLQNLFASAYIRTDFQEDFKINLPIQTSTQISYDYRSNKYNEVDFYGLNLPLSPPFKITSTASQGVGADYEARFITFGYLLNQKIDFGSYGGIAGGFRSDYSSAFGKGSAPFTFPHADGYILPSTFWQNEKVGEILPYFKVRAAFGQAGIQPQPYQRIPIFNQGNIGTGNYYAFQQAPNDPNLKVEVSTEKEVGTDFTVKVGKGDWLSAINGSVTVWSRTSDNVIFNVPLAPSTGQPSVTTNSIGLESHGTTFQLSIPVYKSRTFTWDLTTNFNRQLSSIASIRGGGDIILTSAAGSSGLVLTAGKPIGQLYGFKAIRSLTDPELVDYNTATNTPISQYAMVNGRVVDVTSYQVQFSNIAQPLGNPNPNFNMAFINAFTYKNFLSFSFQFDWLNGSRLYNQTKEWMYRDGIHKDFQQQVAIPGINNGEAKAYTAYWAGMYYNQLGSLYGPGNNGTKDFFYEDNSFLRLRNVQIAVDFTKVFPMKSFKRLQLVLTGRNIMTWTKYTGADPEVSSGASNSSFDRGIDHSTIPNIRSYQVGLNIGF